MVAVFERLERTTTNPHHYYYVVNTVTPGQFQRPAMAGECMYDPATRATTALDRVGVGAE